MHDGLATSLVHIREQCAGTVPLDESALRRIIDDIGLGRRFPPSTFALYYDLVSALLRGETETVAAVLDALGRERPIDAPFTVLSLDDPALARRLERYLRFMNADEGGKFDFLPPTLDDIRHFRVQFDRACVLLMQTMPELLEEIRAIISEIIVVAGPKDAARRFDGGSCYSLWGALFVNAERSRTRVELVEALAHESGHSVLFGLTTEEATVLNPDDERFPSPLRVDNRPMDGVFHATYVSARMHWTMSRLIESGALGEEELALAVKARDEDRRNFEYGYATVAAHARLTATGQAAIDSALAYMKSAA